MKKFLIVLLSVVFAVILCVPLVACNNEEEQTERKRIVGIDSEKTYLKAKYYLANNRDLNYKTLFFEIYSYDKIEDDELNGVYFEITTDDKFELTAEDYELRYAGFINNTYYRYTVSVGMLMLWVTYDLRINSVTLNFSGQNYKLNTDIYFFMHNYRPVFVEPNYYGRSTDSVNGMHCLHISTQYDMTLKSTQLQTEGFEILSYYVEVYNAETDNFEKVAEELPVKLEAKRIYNIYVEVIPPQDCLYYSLDFESVVEISGVEMVYNNIDGIIGDVYRVYFGSALNALNED